MLTNPKSAGYIQNPISVYYCYNKQGTLTRCIAEVSRQGDPWSSVAQPLQPRTPAEDAGSYCVHHPEHESINRRKPDDVKPLNLCEMVMHQCLPSMPAASLRCTCCR